MKVHANGLNFHVNRFRSGPAGDRPIVVCIHGLAVVDNAAPTFVLGFHLAADAEVITYDLRGHGRSDVVPSGYGIADHAADLVALLDALDITVPVHLVAFSYGGAIAMLAAMRHPERWASLTLLDGVVPITGWNTSLGVVEQFKAWLEEAHSQGHAADELADVVVDRLVEEYGVPRRRATSTAKRVHLLMETTSFGDDIRNEIAFDSKEDYSRIDCPVLGVYGDQSDLYWLTDLLPTLIGDVRTHTIVGADHLNVYGRFDEIRPLVRQFVLSTSGTAG